jgi:hypothetical protein
LGQSGRDCLTLADEFGGSRACYQRLPAISNSATENLAVFPQIWVRRLNQPIFVIKLFDVFLKTGGQDLGPAQPHLITLKLSPDALPISARIHQ